MAEQASLFDTLSSQPLAARLRPRTFDEYAGQRHRGRYCAASSKATICPP